ncbi:tetratricopeptide repeat protein [Sphingomonas sp. ID0503]|uniref:tetratricopeptide repeat protein n=1 Tax=Sphingomonas sp. ID0503 TaxID=3399691 RepID=UPI003AFB2E16
MSDPSKMLIAVRRDGLLPRLAALTNARRVAKGLGWNFGFIWPAAPGVPTAEALFEPAFVAAHLVIDYDPLEFSAMPRGPLHERTVKLVVEDEKLRGIAVQRSDQQLTLTMRKPPKLGPGLREVLYGLPLRTETRMVMEQVRDAIASDAVAVEVSASVDPETFVPTSILRHRLERLKAAGRTTVLVGDEDELIRPLAGQYGAIIARDLAAVDGDDPRALADVSALLRCGELIGGSPSVRAARAMADRPVSAIADGLSPDEQARIVATEGLAALRPKWRAATHFFLAGLLDEGGDAQLAALEAAHADDPESSLYARRLVRPLVARGRFAEAETMIRESAERAFEESGKRATGLKGLLDDADKKEEARLLNEACAAFPGPYLHAQLSGVLHDLESYERSYAAARRAFQLNPSSALLALRLGEQAFRARHHEVAREAFAKAVEDAPDSAIAHLGYADALIALGNYNQAYDSLSEASRLDPENAIYVARLAYMEEGRSNPDAADTLILRATALAPGDAEVLGVVSRIYEMRRDFGQAMRTLQSVDTSEKEVRGMKGREKVLRKAIREAQSGPPKRRPGRVESAGEKPPKTNLIVAVQDALTKWWTAGKN